MWWWTSQPTQPIEGEKATDTRDSLLNRSENNEIEEDLIMVNAEDAAGMEGGAGRAGAMDDDEERSLPPSIPNPPGPILEHAEAAGAVDPEGTNPSAQRVVPTKSRSSAGPPTTIPTTRSSSTTRVSPEDVEVLASIWGSVRKESIEQALLQTGGDRKEAGNVIAGWILEGEIQASPNPSNPAPTRPDPNGSPASQAPAATGVEQATVVGEGAIINPREFADKMEKLLPLFPDLKPHTIESALRYCNGEFDDTMDVLMEKPDWLLDASPVAQSAHQQPTPLHLLLKSMIAECASSPTCVLGEERDKGADEPARTEKGPVSTVAPAGAAVECGLPAGEELPASPAAVGSEILPIPPQDPAAPQAPSPPRKPVPAFVYCSVVFGLLGLWALVEKRGLGAACQSGSIVSLRFLHNVRGQPLDYPGGVNCLGTAADNNQPDVVRWVLEQGVNSSRRTREEGMTAAHLSARNGHPAVISVLRERGAPLNLTDKEGRKPCWLAARLGHSESVKELCVSGNDTCGISEAMAATLYGHSQVLESLYQCGVPLTGLEKKGFSLASAAAEGGHTGVLVLLRDKGVDFNQQNRDGSSAIHHAAKVDGHAAIRILKEGGANLTAVNRAGQTALLVAISNNDNDNGEAIETLLSFGGPAVGIDQPDKRGKTPSFLASYKGQAGAMAALIRSGANITKACRRGHTPAYAAAEEGHLNVLNLIAEASGPEASLILERANDNNYTPLHIATQGGHLAAVNRLLELGVAVEPRDILGRTPQSVAVEYGHPSLAQVLFLALPRESIERVGWGMLEACAEKGDLETAKYLVGNGVPVDRRVKGRRDRLVAKAADAGHLEMLKLFVENHQKLDLNGPNGFKIAKDAVIEGHLDVVEYLVGEKGVPLASGPASLVSAAAWNSHDAILEFFERMGEFDRPDRDGDTPCSLAAIKGADKVIDKFCSHGERLHQRNKQNNRTLLFTASLNGHTKMAGSLLAKGVDPNLPDQNGFTAVHAAIQDGDNLPILQSIVAHGGRVDVKSKCGTTPLIYTANHGRERCAQFIVDQQAPLDHANKDGAAICHAAKNGHPSVMGVLHRAGAPLDQTCPGGYSLAHLAAKEGEGGVLSYISKHNPELLERRVEGGDRQSPLDLAAAEGQLGAVRVLAKEGRVALDVPNPINGLTPAEAAGKEHPLIKSMIKIYISERDGDVEGDNEDADDESNPGGEAELSTAIERLLELNALLEKLKQS